MVSEMLAGHTWMSSYMEVTTETSRAENESENT